MIEEILFIVIFVVLPPSLLLYIFYYFGILLYGLIGITLFAYWYLTSSYTGRLITGRLRHLISMKLSIMKSGYNAANAFESSVYSYPNKECIVFEDSVYTYKQVNNMANKIANWATSQGLKSGDCVGLYMSNRPEFIITWLGLMKINVVISLINTDVTGKSLEHVLTVCGTKVLIMGDEMISKFETCDQKKISENIQKVWVYKDKLSLNGNVMNDNNGASSSSISGISYGNLDEALATTSEDDPPLSLRSDASLKSKAFFIFTSGTTGYPKAAIVTHKRVFDIWYSTTIYVGWKSSDRVYVTLPLYHTSGNIIGTTSLFLGATLILRRKFSASKFFSDAVKYRATIFLYIGELIRYLLAQYPTEYDKKHCLRMGFGNGCRHDVWDSFLSRFKVPELIELYSSTEGNVSQINFGKKYACGYLPPFLHYPAFYFVEPMCLIRYDIEKEKSILDDKGHCICCDFGEIRELIGKMSEDPNAPSGNFYGYYGNEDATKKKILRNAFVNGDVYFRTGDLLRQEKDGFLYFVDRIGDTYRWKGQNVATGEVGNVLSSFPGLEEANVYGVQVHGYEGRCGMAAIVLQHGVDAASDGNTFDFDGLYRYTTMHLTNYANPYFLRVTQNMDKTGTFKHKKSDLVKQGFNPTEIKDAIYFRDDSKKTYIRLDPNLYKAISEGIVKL